MPRSSLSPLFPRTDYSFPKEMVSLAAQRCRHWDRVPEDSVVETEEWGTEDRLGDFLEEGRQTYERKLDGLVAEGWHNCLVQSCQELGG